MGKQGRDVYVRDNVYPIFKSLELKKQSSYQLMSLFRSLVSLNADPASGAVANSAATIRNLMADGYAVEYYLDNGDVLVSKIRFSEEFSAGNATRSGLHQVKKVGTGWQTQRKPLERMEFSHKWSGSHYAAVAGKFTGSRVAGVRLSDHIIKAYQKDVLAKNVNIDGNYYSMYWTADSRSYGAHTESDSVASLLQQAADAKAPVNWLVHGEGAKTFKKSLEILQDAPSLSRFAAADEETVRYLRMKFAEQKVYFSNPKGADTKVIETLCKKVGVTFAGSHVSPRNLKNSTGIRNVWNDIQKPVALCMIGGSGFAAAGEQVAKNLGYQNATEGAMALMQRAQSFAGNPAIDQLLPVATAAVGCFIIGKAAVNKNIGAYKAVKALMIGTLGSGDEFWYESDDDLFEQMSA